jgi:putative ubiquitin-RnfH superfamily antitoxin RatB of RatAB toxin-antitoxin module
MNIVVCFSLRPRQVHELPVSVPEGSTLEQALLRAQSLPGWPTGFGPEAWRQLTPGVWGRRVLWTAPLRDADRVELYRPLTVDPKLARKQRFSRQGARRTGLFARRKPGSAAGY